MTKQLYPSWRFHTSGDTVKFPDRKVNSAAEAEALGPGWTNGDTEVYREAEATAPVVPPTGPVPAKVLFPSWRYHQDGRSLLVANEAEADALGPDWTNGDAGAGPVEIPMPSEASSESTDDEAKPTRRQKK